MKRLFLTTVILLVIVKFNYAQTEISKAQASFIYNFTKFFDWPQSEKMGDFVIGVVGSKTLFGDLENVTAGKKNVTQNIVVKYFKDDSEVSKCHVIFVAALKAKTIPAVQGKAGSNSLIISDSRTALEKGAAIQFMLVGDKLRYSFSKENALKNNLKFHSKVVDMASK